MNGQNLSAGTTCERLRRVLREDRSAWKHAVWIGDLAEQADAPALVRERERLQHFLEHHLEPHFAKEEQEIFPMLAERGFVRQVEEAIRQHAELRRLRARLAEVSSGDEGGMRAAFDEIARQLRAHVRYESSFVYDDLKLAEVEEYQEDISMLLAEVAGG